MNDYGLPSPLNAQTLFDTISLHLLRQGRQSLGGFFCAYRGREGRACAVGAVIPDSLYRDEMENVPAQVVIDLVPGLEPLRPYALLLRDLQVAHDDVDHATDDGVFYRERLLAYLTAIAGAHGLSTAAMNRAETIHALHGSGRGIPYTAPSSADPLPEPM